VFSPQDIPPHFQTHRPVLLVLGVRAVALSAASTLYPQMPKPEPGFFTTWPSCHTAGLCPHHCTSRHVCCYCFWYQGFLPNLFVVIIATYAVTFILPGAEAPADERGLAAVCEKNMAPPQHKIWSLFDVSAPRVKGLSHIQMRTAKLARQWSRMFSIRTTCCVMC
jgi:hypothetical protein